MASSSNTGTSALLAGCLYFLLLSGLALNSEVLSESGPVQFVAGVVSSCLFVLALTFLSNLRDAIDFGAAGWIEVVISLVAAVAGASTVHPRCASICVLASLAQLFFLNRISQKTYFQAATTTTVDSKASKRRGRK
eukprot:Rmarinus@m.27968